jgi:hypothetical protein
MLSPTTRIFSGGTFPLTKEKHRKSMTGKKNDISRRSSGSIQRSTSIFRGTGDGMVIQAILHPRYDRKISVSPGEVGKEQRARRSTQKATVPGAKNVGLYPQTAILTGKKDDD